MDDRRLIQMGELCHVIGLVEFARIDLVNCVCIDLLLGAIVALYEEPPRREVVDYPASDESRDRIPKPDVSLAREVIFSLYNGFTFWCLVANLGYELRCECAHWSTVSMRVGA